jgi:alpha/beta superfamily hydrolase
MLIKTITAITLGLSFYAGAWAAPLESEIKVDNGGLIAGTLDLPEGASAVPVVLLVADGGQTDRNGNAPGTNSDCLRQLAQALAAQGIASVRYDKRGVAASAAAAAAGGAPTVARYADDAAAWIQLLKHDARFDKVVVVGHGQGLLVGLLAANAVGANGFVSLAGNSAPASTYDPAAEFGKLKMHARIIQGSADLQVGMDEVHRLEQGRPGTPVAIIKGMNHVLKMADGDLAAQKTSYTDPELPVAPELVTELVGFINMR